jgi:hypothetical protein
MEASLSEVFRLSGMEHENSSSSMCWSYPYFEIPQNFVYFS